MDGLDNLRSFKGVLADCYNFIDFARDAFFRVKSFVSFESLSLIWDCVTSCKRGLIFDLHTAITLVE
jgi:hypothetical protein